MMMSFLVFSLGQKKKKKITPDVLFAICNGETFQSLRLSAVHSTRKAVHCSIITPGRVWMDTFFRLMSLFTKERDKRSNRNGWKH